MNGKPTKEYWANVLTLYQDCGASEKDVNDNEEPLCSEWQPTKNLNIFLSPSVPWKYQNVKASDIYAKTKGLHMIRVWTTTDDNDDLFESTEDGSTVAEPLEITGLVYSDGTYIVWDGYSPVTDATLMTPSNKGIPIDAQHLNVVLFQVPRTIHRKKGDVTVVGTVRQVLETLRRVQVLESNEAHKLSQGIDQTYKGLLRHFDGVMSKSTKYTLSKVDVNTAVTKRMTFERAKWQAKIKNIVGRNGGMNRWRTDYK